MIRGFGGRAVNTSLYQQLKAAVASAAEAADAVVEEVGELSNGEQRPVVRFNQDADEQLLIIAGEDGDELAPVLEMPEIIQRIRATEPNVGVNIIPYFDVTPSLEDLTGTTGIDSYEKLRKSLTSFDSYTGSELRARAGEQGIDDAQKPYSMADVDAIHEVLLNSDIVAIDVETQSAGEILRRNFEAVVDILYDDIPHRFYFPVFDQDPVTTTFYKTTLTYDGDVVLHTKPVYACANEEPRPAELREVVDFAKNCDYGITLHQNDADPFFLLSYHIPNSLTERLRENARKEGIQISTLDDADEFYYDIESIDEGIVRLDTIRYEMTAEFVKEGYVATELPQDRQSAAALAAHEVTDFVEYFDY